MDLFHMLPAEMQIAVVWRSVWLLQTCLAGALMIVVVVILRALALYRLPKKLFLAMWGIVLARLLIPLEIPSRFSMYTLYYLRTVEATEAQAGVGQATVTIPAGTWNAAPSTNIQSMDLASVIVAVWLIGMLVCAAFFLVMYVRCRREFRASLPIQSEAVSSWLKNHPLRRRISIRQTDRISAPLSYGIFHPVILLPKTFDLEDENALNYVLTHEFVHISRFDALAKCIIVAAACVHWFNPLMWVLYVLANRDIELTCDEAVIKRLGQESRAGYIGVLISMVETRLRMTPVGNHFSRTAIEERVAAIAKPRKASAWALALTLMVVIASTVVFATSPDTTGMQERVWRASFRDAIVRQAAIDYVNVEMMQSRKPRRSTGNTAIQSPITSLPARRTLTR